LATDWLSWRAQGIDPELTAQGAFAYAMLALQGQLVAIALLMALYLSARTARGLVTRPRNTTFDVVSLVLLYTSAQGTATALLLRFVPAGG
jgi:cytochrome c oxidase subunit I+III